MRLVKKTRLYFHEGRSDKIYEVELCELEQTAPQRFIVNFRFGRRGSELREGTKTVEPVTVESAQKIYDSVVVSKVNEGYTLSELEISKSENTPDDLNLILTETSAPTPANPPLTVRQRIEERLLTKFNSLMTVGDFNAPELKRVIWRAGELRMLTLITQFVPLLTKGDKLLDYCIAWSLGRSRDNDTQAVLHALGMNTQHESVKRISFAALLEVAPARQCQELLKTVLAKLPTAWTEFLTTNRLQELESHLVVAIEKHTVALVENLYGLYLYSKISTPLYKLLLNLIPSIPAVTPNRFKALRAIFKTAELRDDGLVLGVVNALFERSRRFYTSPDAYLIEHDYSIYVPEIGEEVHVDREVQKPDSRIAYSDRTRAYLRLRAWRLLRKRGRAEDPSYVALAVGMLLAVKDGDGSQAFTKSLYCRRDDGSRRGKWEWRDVEYTRFSQYIAFNYILYANSSRITPKGSKTILWRWKDKDNRALQHREEAFPEIWDKNPAALVELLCASQCVEVHAFADLALRAHRNFWPQIATTQIAIMLQCDYATTGAIGLEIGISVFRADNPNIELLQALISSPWPDARRQALQWLTDNRELLKSHNELCLALLTCNDALVFQWWDERFASLQFDAVQQQALLARLLAMLLGFTDAADNTRTLAVIDALTWHMTHSLKEQTQGLDLRILQDLLRHSLKPLQLLAGRLLLNNQCPPEQMPAAIFMTLLASDSPEICALGVSLYSKLPLSVLKQQVTQITQFCMSPHADVRNAIRFLLRRIMIDEPALAIDIEKVLIHVLFKAEPFEGLHDELLAMLTRDLVQEKRVTDKDLVWRLVNAQSKAANRYGGFLLKQLDPRVLSVRQWASLGKNYVLEVRTWVQKNYQNNVETIRQNPMDALRILETRWDDTRRFAIDYFRSHFTKEHWTAELMIGVCDNIRDDVQAFGRELITQYFDNGAGQEYLSKLSQHPSVTVQLFTTNYLTHYAGGALDKIQELAPYFVTVLSQVNKGRVAKVRVITFLREQALASAEIAKIVANIFTRQSVTLVLRDHTQYLLAMRDIQFKYPFIELPIKKRAVPSRLATVQGL